MHALLPRAWVLGDRSEMTGRGLDDPVHAVIRGLARGDPIAATIALTPSAAATGRHSLLGKAWLGRWQRSHAKFPEGLAPSAEEAFAEKILQHPQFR